MRQSLLRYMQTWHGSAYALTYRFAMILSAVVRLVFVSLALLIARDKSKSEWLLAARTKWMAIFRWGCGLEPSAVRSGTTV